MEMLTAYQGDHVHKMIVNCINFKKSKRTYKTNQIVTIAEEYDLKNWLRRENMSRKWLVELDQIAKHDQQIKGYWLQ